MKSLKLLLLLLLIVCLTVGCWDKVEIEDRMFVLAIGVDTVAPEARKSPDDRFTLSFASPVPSQVKDSKGPAFNTYKTIDSSVTVSLNELLERFAKQQIFEHTRVLVIGEDVVKDEKLFKAILDAMMRFHSFHESMQTFIVPGKAEDVFKVKPKFDNLLAPYITGIADHSALTARITKSSLSDLTKDMANQDGNGTLARLTPFDEEIKINGLGIIKKYKLLGYLSEEEGMVDNWLTGKAKAGVIQVRKGEAVVPYMYSTFKRRIKMDKVEGGKIYLSYNLETEGMVEEYSLGEDLMDEKLLEDIELKVEKNIEEEAGRLVQKLQHDYGMDLIGASDFVRKYHPNLYKSMGGKDPDFFSGKLVINIKADAKIRRIGTTK